MNNSRIFKFPNRSFRNFCNSFSSSSFFYPKLKKLNISAIYQSIILTFSVNICLLWNFRLPLRPFHRTLPKFSAFVNRIAVRFYETDCIKNRVKGKVMCTWFCGWLEERCKTGYGITTAALKLCIGDNWTLPPPIMLLSTLTLYVLYNMHICNLFSLKICSQLTVKRWVDSVYRQYRSYLVI